MLDLYTYGNSMAAITLVKILEENENKRLVSHVSNIWNDFCVCMRNLERIEDSRVKKFLASMVKKHFVELVGKKPYPEKVRTFLNNLIVSKYRLAMRK